MKLLITCRKSYKHWDPWVNVSVFDINLFYTRFFILLSRTQWNNINNDEKTRKKRRVAKLRIFKETFVILLNSIKPRVITFPVYNYSWMEHAKTNRESVLVYPVLQRRNNKNCKILLLKHCRKMLNDFYHICFLSRNIFNLISQW